MANIYYDDNNGASVGKGRLFDLLLVTALGAVTGALIAIQQHPGQDTPVTVSKAFVGPAAPAYKSIKLIQKKPALKLAQRL